MKTFAVLVLLLGLGLSSAACNKTDTKPADKMGGAPPPAETDLTPDATPPAEEAK